MSGFRTACVIFAAMLLAVSQAHAEVAPRVCNERVVLHTIAGDIVLALYPEIAPKHTEQILNLVRRGVYDTTHIRWIHPTFSVQVSGATERSIETSDEQLMAIHRLKAEFSTKLKHHSGTLSMSRHENDPDSAEVSFSILLSDAPQLDGKYTIFGHVEFGMDVLDRMKEVPRNANNQPLLRLQILRAEVVASRKVLDQMILTAAQPVPIPGGLNSGEALNHIAAGIGLMIAIGLASYFLSSRISLRTLHSLILINVLVGSFLLGAAFTPIAHNYPTLAIVMFLGVLGMIKLMGRFESP